MKPQVILFALLRAQAALSEEGSTAMLPDCASPCKTNLRSSESKLSECVRSHCGVQFQMKEEGKDIAQSPNACVARCLRLRFSAARQQQCIENCDRDEGDAGDRSVINVQVAEYDAEEEGEDVGGNVAQSPDACVARCLRLRFSAARQQQCIENCNRDEEEDDRFVPDTEVAEYDAKEEEEHLTARKSTGGKAPREQNACVARCLRLRFSAARQQQCIENCDRDEEDAGDRSVINAQVAEYDAEEEGEDVGGNVAQSPDACVARCLRLRFSAARQQQCIENCNRAEEEGNRFVPDTEVAEYDAEEEEEHLTARKSTGGKAPREQNACVARCLRLRFSAARQQQCIENCDRAEEDGDGFVPDAEAAAYDAVEEEGEGGGENASDEHEAYAATA